MRTLSLSGIVICTALVFIIGMSSCSKEISASGPRPAGTSPTSPIIAVGVDSAGSDSVYIRLPYGPGSIADSIAATGLPSNTTAYLDSSYSGFSFLKGYVIKDSAGTVEAYVVIISYHGNPVALLFNSGGNLVQVLEQRERGDLYGRGWHEGGRFRNRGRLQKDSIAVSALPASIQSYMTDNYPKDTLVIAYIGFDSSYLVISRDSGVFATLFTSAGTFIKRVELPAPAGLVQAIAQSGLPASALTYLSNTYPGFVFEQAFSLTVNNTVEEYEVIIDANNTRYGVVFDPSGNFVAARIIW
jgi:hypothetical protein